MTTNQFPEFDPGREPDRESAPPGRPLGPVPLKRLLRRRLRHHLDRSGFGPSLEVLGLRAHDLVPLRTSRDRPEDAVLGYTLPSGYDAIVVVAASVVASSSTDRTHRDAALALAVQRHGPTQSLLATTDDLIETHEPHGWLIDACLRSVGRPTPPCDASALTLPIALWLDRLMVTIVTSAPGASIGWHDAVELCPVPARWRCPDPVDLGTTLGSTARPWRRLRASAAGGEPSPIAIDPDHARWMDDAMFARWCLGSFPDLASLRGDVEFLAPDSVAAGVELALRAAWAAFEG